MSLQRRSMHQLSGQVGNNLPRRALKRACSAGTYEKAPKPCVREAPPQSSLSGAKCTYSQSLRKATSAADRAPVTRKRLSTRAVPPSLEVPRSVGQAHCLPQLVRKYRRERPAGALYTRLTELSGRKLSQGPSSSRQRVHVHNVQQELVCSSASLIRDWTRSAASPEAANALKHELLQYQRASRGSVIGYSSPKHILKQQARSHAALGLAHGPARGEGRGAAGDVLVLQCGPGGRTNKTYKENQPASPEELQREGEEEASFHTLQCSSLSDVRTEFRAECDEKSAMRAPLCTPFRNAGDIQTPCLALSAKSDRGYSYIPRDGSKSESVDMRELKKNSSNSGRTCRGEGGTAHIAARICAEATGTYTGSCASSRKGQPKPHPQLAPRRTYPSVEESRSDAEKPAASSISDNRKIATSCPSSAVAESPRCSPEVPFRTLARQKVKCLISSRGCVRERVFCIRKATVHRATQSTNTTELPGGHSSLKRRGKVLRVLPASPASRPTKTERRALHNACGTTPPSSKVRSATQSLTAQKEADGAPSVSIQTKLSLPHTTFEPEGYRAEGNIQSNVIQKRRHPEAPLVMLPQSRQQATCSDHADPAVACQIIEHSWMFPRDEYRPPLSPQIPFNLDDDEDATASAILVSLAEELPSLKREVSEEDRSNQVTSHFVRNPAGKEEDCQSTTSDASPNVGVSGSAGKFQSRIYTTQDFSSGAKLPAASSGCERPANVEQTHTVDGGDESGLSESEKLLTTAEDLAGPPFVPSQSGARPYTPPTDWCTTRSTAWLSSSATATDDLNHISSPCDCTREGYEFKIKNDPTVVALKEFVYSTEPERWEQQMQLAVDTPSSIGLLEARRVHSTANENNLAISEPGAELASDHTKLTKVSCEHGFSRMAHTKHTPASAGAGQICDSATVADGSPPNVIQLVQVRPRRKREPKGKHGTEEMNETDRHNRAVLVAPQPAAESTATSIPLQARKEIYYGLSGAPSQQQLASKVLCLCGYKSWRTHPRAVDSGVFHRADAFARYGRLPIGCASKRYSRNTSDDTTRKQRLLAWQSVEDGVDPTVLYMSNRGSTQGTTDSLEDESTTSDDCSSDCSSRDTSGTSPVVRQIDSRQGEGDLSLRSLHGASNETPFLSHCPTSRVAPRMYQRKGEAPEMLHRAYWRLHESDVGGRRRAQNQGPQASPQVTFWHSCPALSVLGEVGRDLEVARRHSVHRERELAKEHKLEEACQDSTFVVGSGCRKINGAKEQPSVCRRTMWRFLGWTFGRRRHASRVEREEQ